MYAEPYPPTYTNAGMGGMPAGGFAQPAAYPTYVAPVNYSSGNKGGFYSRFTPLNCCALLCALTIFAVMIATSTVCWFHNDETYQAAYSEATGTTTFTLNHTKTCYDLEGASTDFYVNGGSHTARFLPYDSSSSVWSIFKLVQSFVLIALILAGILSFFLVVCFAASVRNRLLFMVGMNVLRMIMLLIAVMILISLIIAFLGFLGITKAFDDDTPSCNNAQCRRFSDSVKEDRGTQVATNNQVTTTVSVTRLQDFGPDAGWFLTLAMIPIAILLCICVGMNKFPIPVDSVGSGEAL
jgi:hypothetical protein